MIFPPELRKDFVFAQKDDSQRQGLADRFFHCFPSPHVAQISYDGSMERFESLTDMARMGKQEKSRVKIGPTAFVSLPYLWNILANHEYQHAKDAYEGINFPGIQIDYTNQTRICAFWGSAFTNSPGALIIESRAYISELNSIRSSGLESALPVEMLWAKAQIKKAEKRFLELIKKENWEYNQFKINIFRYCRGDCKKALSE